MTIPQELKLSIPDLPESFSGRLYFVLGPGLGDTVNDFRILHEVLGRYPRARPVAYADPRWKALYEQVLELAEAEVRYHSPAPSGHKNGDGSSRPYHKSFASIVGEILEDSRRTDLRVALGGFKCADQLARGESGLANKARAIRLPLPPARRRPYVPPPPRCLEEASAFLAGQGLAAGSYVAVAPHTAPGKMWPRDHWEGLIEHLSETLGLPVVLLGMDGAGMPGGKRVVPAWGLSLPVVAALLQQARAYVGLDSGLTHLASAFDLPLVALNPRGKFPPFLVEANSPSRWTVLTPGLYGASPITPDCAQAVVTWALRDVSPPGCPLCGRVPYVLAAKAEGFLFLCRCGLLFRLRREKAAPRPADRAAVPDGLLPRTAEALEAFRGALRAQASQGRQPVARLAFEHWDPVRLDPAGLLQDPSDRTLWWTWDAAYRLVTECGCHVAGSRVERGAGGAALPVTLEVARGSAPAAPAELEMPWGTERVQVSRVLYERWLTWGAFHKQDELEGLGWLLVQEGRQADGEAILRLALREGLRWKTLARWLRARWLGPAPLGKQEA